MPGPTLPKSFTGLFARGVPGKGEGGAQPAASKGGLAGGLAAAKDAGPETGPSALGADGELLEGLGFNTRDRTTFVRNMSERANINRFIQEQMPPQARLDAADMFEAPADAPAEAPGETEAPAEEAGRSEDAPAERTEERKGPEERRELAQADLRDAQEADLNPGELETPDAEGESDGQDRDGDDGEDEEDRPGAGWMAEELEERKRRRRFQVDGAEGLGPVHRCRGTLEDGSRCLRKPLPGTPYCREHR